MPTVIKRCISLLLILMLVVSLIPSVYAAETADEAGPAASTETTEETTNTEPEENMIPPPNETEAAIAEEPGNNLSEADIIDDSEPPVMLLIDGEVALASISNCQATTWATIWVNTDEYSPIAGNGDFSKVEFILHNETDNYYVKAALNESEGVYYVTAHVANEADATHFIPVSSGKVVVKGLEDDTYRITEVRTDNGYTLLKEDIEVVISQTETASLCDDVAGSVEHHLLTASARVDGNPVTMLEDNGSDNAEAPLTVVNTRGFDLPETGDNGTMMFTIVGILLMAGAAGMIVLTLRRKRNS